MPVNARHFAVLVGFTNYPELGDSPPSNLEGPGNDVAAVYEWLVDPQGGGLRPENVFKVTSTDAPEERGKPTGSEIQNVVADFARRAEALRRQRPPSS